MSATIGTYSALAYTLAVLAFFVIESHNGRAVLFVTLFTIGTICLILSFAAANSNKITNLQSGSHKIFALSQYFSWQFPPYKLILGAVAAVITITLLALLLEIVDARNIRRPHKNSLIDLTNSSLGLSSQSSAVTITVLIPARNEELSLPQTLESLRSQTRPPEKIIVVADNCTDATVDIARRMDCEAFETIDNTDRKGGALNQVLKAILPGMGRGDLILVMDADSQIDNGFLATALEHFQKFPVLDAVGGSFFGEPHGGLLGQLQRNEFTRYSDQINRRRGRVFVLTGTASVFRAEALDNVARARGIDLLGKNGEVYDTAALTEDNELTIALKTLGSAMISPPGCRVTTELMPSWNNLWDQRLRWQRGAIENLGGYGFTRTTIRYWGQQIAIAYGTFALSASILGSIILFLTQDHWVWYPFWMAIGSVFILERVWTVRRAGRAAILLALPLVPELAYDIFLQLIFIKALIDTISMRRDRWGSVRHLRVAVRRKQ